MQRMQDKHLQLFIEIILRWERLISIASKYQEEYNVQHNKQTLLRLFSHQFLFLAIWLQWRSHAIIKKLDMAQLSTSFIRKSNLFPLLVDCISRSNRLILSQSLQLIKACGNKIRTIKHHIPTSDDSCFLVFFQ